MTRVACLAVALVSAVPLAGCGGPGTATAPATAAPPATVAAAAPTVATTTASVPVTAADLAGRTFLIDAERSDGQLRPTTHGGPVVFTFGQPMLGVDSACNGFGAEWRVDGGRLQLVGDVYSTAMLCGDPALEAQDGWVGRLIGERPEVRLDGDDIELRTPTATLRGRDQRSVRSTRSLVGPTWHVLQVYHAASARGGGHAGMPATFGDDGRVRVTTGGCGPLRGTYVVQGARLDVRLTERPAPACGTTSLHFEHLDVMVDLLDQPLDVLERGDQVRLTAADGSAIVLQPR